MANSAMTVRRASENFFFRAAKWPDYALRYGRYQPCTIWHPAAAKRPETAAFSSLRWSQALHG
eukprot:2566469-Amphidinium_carterae.1